MTRPSIRYSSIVHKNSIGLCKMKPDFVRVYPTLVVKGASLEQEFYKGKYRPLSVREAVDWVKDIKFIFEHHGIDIIRIGLQAQEGFDEGKDLVVGPYHPAIGEMVESIIYRDWMEDIIKQELDTCKVLPKNIIFQVNLSRLSQAIGQKRSNVRYLKEKLPDMIITIKQNNNVDRQEMITIVNGKLTVRDRIRYVAQRYEGIQEEI